MILSVSYKLHIPDGLQVLRSGHLTNDPSDVEYVPHQITNVRNYLIKTMHSVGIDISDLTIER